MKGIAWPGLMRLGMGELGLAPEVFWRLTPAELMLLAGQGVGPGAGPASMSRAGFEALAARFPDVGARVAE